MTPEFRNALYNWEYIDSSEKDEALSIPYQLQKLFLNLQVCLKISHTHTLCFPPSLTIYELYDVMLIFSQIDIYKIRSGNHIIDQKFRMGFY